MQTREGKLPVEGGMVYYRISGENKSKTPLLALHGGPGAAHDYLLLLEELSDERTVILYDQLGGGNSDRPDDPSLWTIERFAREVETVRNTLGLESLHILGQSWGAALAVEYLHRYGSEGVRSLILSAPFLETARWEEDAERYLAQLPPGAQQDIRNAVQTQTFDSESYQAAMNEYYKRHLCRLDPWPPELNQTFEKLGVDVYQQMWGPSEFTVTGTLKTYTALAQLQELDLPVLFTAGEFDEASPDALSYYLSFARRGKAIVFSDASHMHHMEKRSEYLAAVREFLKSVEP